MSETTQSEKNFTAPPWAPDYFTREEVPQDAPDTAEEDAGELAPPT
jgi:hypothetical protein